jgi:hypothetical protein
LCAPAGRGAAGEGIGGWGTDGQVTYISNRWDASGGVQELSGDLRKGGRIRGKFAREWMFKRLDRDTQVHYRWNLEFDARLE